MLREDKPGEKRLVAYVVSRSAIESSWHAAHYLQQQVPNYMIPAVFVLLEALPCSQWQGDRNLPAPDERMDWQKSMRPAQMRSSRGRCCDGNGREVLNRERIGVRDNFFTSAETRSSSVLVSRSGTGAS